MFVVRGILICVRECSLLSYASAVRSLDETSALTLLLISTTTVKSSDRLDGMLLPL